MSPEGAANHSMNLAEALVPLVPGGSGVIAFVGAGGKTSALFHLGRELEARGRSVLVTTTTHLADPRVEPGPFSGNLVFRPDMEFAREDGPGLDGAPGLTVLVSREADTPGKVKGIHPSWIPALKRAWDFVLVEADGSKRLSIKAPAPHEPVIPPGTDLVVGVVGLDCLGRPMDGRTVHRPERFARITGCDPGAAVGWEHLAALARHPEGLFKGAGTAPRVVLLNKADRAPFLPSQGQLGDLAADLVLVGTLEDPERDTPALGRRSRNVPDPGQPGRGEGRGRPRHGMHRPPRARGIPGRGPREQPAQRHPQDGEPLRGDVRRRRLRRRRPGGPLRNRAGRLDAR